jgi:hypothetical protein
VQRKNAKVWSESLGATLKAFVLRKTKKQRNLTGTNGLGFVVLWFFSLEFILTAA